MSDNAPIPVPGLNEAQPKIGIGLENTIADIVRGDREIDDVDFIYESCELGLSGGFEKLCERLKGGSWKEFHAEAIEVAHALIKTKVKIQRNFVPIIVGGKHWVNSPSDIHWYTTKANGEIDKRKIVRLVKKENGTKEVVVLSQKEFDEIQPLLSGAHRRIQVGD